MRQHSRSIYGKGGREEKRIKLVIVAFVYVAVVFTSKTNRQDEFTNATQTGKSASRGEI
jgi:hypothetical protein